MRTPFQQSCDKMIEDSIREREARGVNVSDEDDDDRERFGGPVTSGMVITVMNACRYDSEFERLPVHREFDVERMARLINSWLVPVN